VNYLSAVATRQTSFVQQTNEKLKQVCKTPISAPKNDHPYYCLS
jgi:hypothetical protein